MHKARAFLVVCLLVCLPACAVLAPTPTPTPAPTLTPTGYPTPLPPFATPSAFPTRPAIQPGVYLPTCEALDLPAYAPPARPLPRRTPLPFTTAPSLRDLAQARGVWIGATLHVNYLEDPAYAALLAREFNILTPEMETRWDYIHPQPEVFDFSYADTVVAFAEANQMAVIGNSLVWEYNYPEWLTQAERSREEWMHLLCTHVKTIVSHYRGHIFAWHVVNEAFENDGALRDTLWMRKIGPEYIAMAFQWAHEADPAPLLVYNDNAGEGLNVKSQAIYSLAQGLVQMGIPIHAIGMQLHVWLYGPPRADDLAANMQRLAEIGLQAHITELDVRIQYSPQGQAARLETQAEVYRQVLSTCLAAPNCNVFTTWGLTDRYSWIPWFTGQTDAPLLFDEQGRPKPAYDAVMDVLRQP